MRMQAWLGVRIPRVLALNQLSLTLGRAVGPTSSIPNTTPSSGYPVALLWAGRSSAVTDGTVTKPAAQMFEYSEALHLESGDVTSERRLRTLQSSGWLLQPAIASMPADKLAGRSTSA